MAGATGPSAQNQRMRHRMGLAGGAAWTRGGLEASDGRAILAMSVLLIPIITMAGGLYNR